MDSRPATWTPLNSPARTQELLVLPGPLAGRRISASQVTSACKRAALVCRRFFLAARFSCPPPAGATSSSSQQVTQAQAGGGSKNFFSELESE